MLASCSRSDVVDQFVSIPDQKWDYEFQPEIAVDVQDQNQEYRVFLNVKHNHNYPYSNLYIVIHLPSQHPSSLPNRIELVLAEPDGKWTGKGNGGQFTHQQIITENYKFPDTGRMIFRLEQNMRDNPLAGVISCGLRIEPVK